MERGTDRRALANDAEEKLGGGVRRHDVRRDAAFDEPNGVMRPPEEGILGHRHAAKDHQRIEQLVDG